MAIVGSVLSPLIRVGDGRPRSDMGFDERVRAFGSPNGADPSCARIAERPRQGCPHWDSSRRSSEHLLQQRHHDAGGAQQGNEGEMIDVGQYRGLLDQQSRDPARRQGRRLCGSDNL